MYRARALRRAKQSKIECSIKRARTKGSSQNILKCPLTQKKIASMQEKIQVWTRMLMQQKMQISMKWWRFQKKWQSIPLLAWSPGAYYLSQKFIMVNGNAIRTTKTKTRDIWHILWQGSSKNIYNFFNHELRSHIVSESIMYKQHEQFRIIKTFLLIRMSSKPFLESFFLWIPSFSLDTSLTNVLGKI